MSKIDRDIIKKKLYHIYYLDSELKKIINKERIQQENVSSAIENFHSVKVKQTLRKIDIDQINKYKEGIRIKFLKKAGIKNINQIANMSPQRIYRIPGIGEQSTHKIMHIVDTIVEQVSRSTYIRISVDNTSSKSQKLLIKELYILINSRDIRRKCCNIYSNYHEIIERNMTIAQRVNNRLKWFFSSSKKKKEVIEALESIDNLLNGNYCDITTKVIAKYNDINSVNSKSCWQDFEAKSSVYYAEIEKFNKNYINKDNVIDGLPAKLVKDVENEILDLEYFSSTLRYYQEFGVKYMLHQKNVLFGDEMGLGKTVQAIATMTCLYKNGKTHFLVICPLSVLINWYREVKRHSSLDIIKIHGCDSDECINQWINDGGVAVTTYETSRKIRLPKEFRYDMLVADEAHFIKNPGALRTMAVLRLRQNSDRSIFMTGTPLENNVEEMCFLVRCLQPIVAAELEQVKFLSTVSQFKEKLAPVYLRRTRDDVLYELPDLVENEEWCYMTAKENEVYYKSVMAGNFMEMRQVSWNIQNIEESSKAKRLIEICNLADEEDRKIIVFSYFRDTISKVCELLGERCIEPITGSVSAHKRQEIIDKFTNDNGGKVLVSQVQAGGTGLNIQTASIVIFCEPQVKPSIENQAISRTYRMGQIRKVLVYRLLSENSIDERITEILRRKQFIFDNFADESVVANENIKVSEHFWNKIIGEEQARLTNVS